MADGSGRSSSGFWKTTLGIVTQVGIILSAVAGIVAGVITITGDDQNKVVVTATPSATAANEAAEHQLPADCVAEPALGKPQAATSKPKVLDAIHVHARPSALTTGVRLSPVSGISPLPATLTGVTRPVSSRTR